MSNTLLDAPVLTHRDHPFETVTQMCWFVDRRNWSALRQVFGDTVRVDYTELFGGDAGEVATDALVSGWRTNLSRLDATHHALSSLLVADIGIETADVTANVVATHRLAVDGRSRLFTVGGHYEFRLAPHGDRWRIEAITLHVSYLTGDGSVIGVAEAQR